MKYTGVYVWNLIGTDKYYVGQSIDVCARTMQHLASIEDPDCNTKWAKALKEFGPLAFEIIRGVPCSTDKEKLDALEVELIQQYNAYYDGFNSTRGNHWDKKTVEDAVKTSREQRMLPVTSELAKTIYTNISTISEFMPNDIPIGIKDYAVRKINELLNLIYDAMDADTELVTANKDNFTAFFPNWMHFHSLSGQLP